MANKKLNKSPEIIEFKLIDLEIKSFSEKNFAEYGLTSADFKVAKVGTCNIGFNLKIDNKKGLIALPMIVEFFLGLNNKSYKLFSIETVHTFKLKKVGDLFKKNENDQYNMPDAFISHILGIAIGGTRGMLVASNKIPEYKKIMLPLIPTSHLIDSYKKGGKRAKIKSK